MFIDTHAHVNFNFFKDDADDVTERALKEHTWHINIGADFKTSRRALDIANRYERGVYAAVGLHPMHLFAFRAKTQDYDFHTRGEEWSYDNYEKLAKFQKVVAIGEVGLDYYHMDIGHDAEKIKNTQKDVFWQQLLLARRLGLPVIIHCRQAYDDLIELLRKFKKEHRNLFSHNQPWGVKHCYSGDEDMAWQFFNLGLVVGFTGLITFSKQWDNLIRKLPNDKFILETDCPWLTPVPHRGKRNEPSYVKFVAQRIAEIKGVEVGEIEDYTTETARNLFKI